LQPLCGTSTPRPNPLLNPGRRNEEIQLTKRNEPDLTWNTATGDADGDTPCSGLNALVVTQHTDLVVEHGGGEFDFQSADDFLTAVSPLAGLSGDKGDYTSPFVGSCKKQ